MKSEVKSSALTGFGFDPNSAAVALDDFFAQSEADAGAGIFFAGVEALEDEKDALEIFGWNADTVVAHGELPFGGFHRFGLDGARPSRR